MAARAFIALDFLFPGQHAERASLVGLLYQDGLINYRLDCRNRTIIKWIIAVFYRVNKRRFTGCNKPGSKKDQNQEINKMQWSGQLGHVHPLGSLAVNQLWVSRERFNRFSLNKRNMALATGSPGGMVNSDFNNGTRSRVTGNTIFPQLQGMRNRRRGAGQG